MDLEATYTIDVNSMKEWATEHRVEERTVAAFWANLRHYVIEEPNECRSYFDNVDEQAFTVELSHIGLNLENWPRCAPIRVVAYVPIVYRRKPLGMFRAVYSLTGEVVNDFFTLY
jgi:hypothetical protein